MKRTVEEPKRSVKAPIFSSAMVISGRLPFHEILAKTSPEALVIVVYRRSPFRSSGFRAGADFFRNEAEEELEALWLEDDACAGSSGDSATFCTGGERTVTML